MNKTKLLRRLGRYGAVGIIAAAVHAGILLLLSQTVPVDAVCTQLPLCAHA